MAGFNTTLNVLLESENGDVPRLLGYALTRGEMGLRRQTVARLIETSDGLRQGLLVRHFDGLGQELERLVLEGIGRLGPGLRAAMASHEPAQQLAALRLIREAQDHCLAYLAGEAAKSADEAVRTQAVDLLWRWALDLRRHEMELRGAADVLLDAQFARRRKFVLEGLQPAFAMRQAAQMPRVLTAAAMLANGSAGWFWAAMDNRQDVRRQALMGRLAEKLEPEVLGFVVRALNREGLARDAAALLNREFDGRTLEALLVEFDRQSPLARSGLSPLREAPWLGAGEAALESLPVGLVATALALAAGSGMARARLAVLCRGVALNHAQAEARRVAVEALAHCGEAAGDELLLVAGKAATPSAGLAVLHLARLGALDAISDAVVGNLLRDWWELGATERREIARSLVSLLRDRPGLVRGHLSAASPSGPAAVNLIRLAQATEMFGHELQGLAGDGGDVRVQSAALAAVAESLAHGAAEMLQAALASSDARVRANALEGLDGLQARDDVFLRFTADANNRVRANASLALIRRERPEGRETLQRLFSGGEADRVSALWVFSRARPNGFKRTAELLAQQDPSSAVRRKAAALLTSA